jgi:hypothetical protein
MAAGKLEVEITGRVEKLEQALNKAEGKVKKTGKTLDDEMSTPMGKMAVKAGKLFAAMGAIEGATKLASTATSGLQGLFASMEGDAEEAQRHFDAMAETAKSLPFGVGPVVAAFEQILMAASGLNEVLAEQEEKLKEIARLDKLIMMHRSNQSAIGSLEKRLAIAKATTDEEKAHLTFLAELAALEEAHAKRMDAVKSEGQRTREKVRKDSERMLEIETELIGIKRTEALQRIAETKEIEKQRKLEEEKLNTKTEAEKKAAKELLILRKQERVHKENIKLAEDAADVIKKRQEEEEKQKADAASATSSAQTAFGTFKFGQIRQGGGQEKANAHLQGIEQGVQQIINTVSIAMRGIGFG